MASVGRPRVSFGSANRVGSGLGVATLLMVSEHPGSGSDPPI